MRYPMILVCVLALGVAAAAAAQQHDGAPFGTPDSQLRPAKAQNASTIPTGTYRQISSVDGKDLYIEFCARCHGMEGKGDGPRAKELTRPVADLTRIASRNEGTFNRSVVERFISGEDRPGMSRLDLKTGNVVISDSRGDSPMPVFHFLFRKMWPDHPVQIRIGSIVRFLERLQVTN